MTRNTGILVALAGLALALGGSPALGQQNKKNAPEEPILKGPTVRETGVPGEQRQFGTGKQRAKDMMGGEIPHRAFMKCIEALRSDEVAADVRLTAEQQSQIRKINEEFNSVAGKYRETHREEVRQLISQLSPEDQRRAREFLARMGENPRQGGDRPRKQDGGAPMTDPKQSEQARERLRELLAAAPSPADTHARIFAVLTDPQKKAFRAEMEKMKEQMDAGRGIKGLQNKDAKKEGEKKDDIEQQLPERARERLKNMSPEEREKALERLRSMSPEERQKFLKERREKAKDKK